MNIGVFSGSFNPIHHGHLIIANYMLAYTPLDEVWFMLSPQNPHKKETDLLDSTHRMAMVKLATKPFKQFKASDFELQLPRPSYTWYTLQALQKGYPQHTFSLIIGADNWETFDQWLYHKEILQHHHLWIYQRLHYTLHVPSHLATQATAVPAPIVEISSTFIRNALAKGKDVSAFTPRAVWQYIQQHQLYH